MSLPLSIQRLVVKFVMLKDNLRYPAWKWMVDELQILTFLKKKTWQHMEIRSTMQTKNQFLSLNSTKYLAIQR